VLTIRQTGKQTDAAETRQHALIFPPA